MAYDNTFNLSSMGGSTNQSNADNRAVSFSVGGFSLAGFVYDGLGRCLLRAVGEVTRLLVYEE